MVARVAAAVGGGRHEEHEAKSEGGAVSLYLTWRIEIYISRYL